jgi:starch-binding outer membrane protein, SusD/RagB family
MRYIMRLSMALAFTATLAMTTTGCDDFVEVRTPDIIDAGTVDPAADGETFSRSAFQTFASAFGDYIRHQAWFTAEAWVGDTFPTRNEFGRREVRADNGTHNGVWFTLSRSVSQSDQAIEALEDAPGADADVNIARAALASGYGALLIAESWCEAPLRQPGNLPGPALGTNALLDAAIQRLTRARNVATNAGGTEASRIAQAAQVGIARAHLQAGRTGDAAAAAGQVDPDFVFEIPYIDQLGERGRLGNGVFLFSAGGSRESLVVPPAYREMGIDTDEVGEQDLSEMDGDPRILWRDAGRPAQDGTLTMYSQMKFPGWAAPIRLASGLEARYIAAEASGDLTQMITLINERREAGNQAPTFVSADPDEVLAELMDQKHRDFWLEGQRLGDFRRNPNHVPNVLGPGDQYYKPAVGDMGSQTCWPITQAEIDANPNL